MRWSPTAGAARRRTTRRSHLTRTDVAGTAVLAWRVSVWVSLNATNRLVLRDGVRRLAAPVQPWLAGRAAVSARQPTSGRVPVGTPRGASASPLAQEAHAGAARISPGTAQSAPEPPQACADTVPPAQSSGRNRRCRTRSRHARLLRHCRCRTAHCVRLNHRTHDGLSRRQRRHVARTRARCDARMSGAVNRLLFSTSRARHARRRFALKISSRTHSTKSFSSARASRVSGSRGEK